LRWETNTPGHEMSKDCVTVLTCAIASGNHKLPLLMIGILKKKKNPKDLKNLKNLPTSYMNQKRGWKNNDLFLQWFTAILFPK
jgi:hypothetical protein